jgi:hypothetical protein
MYVPVACVYSKVLPRFKVHPVSLGSKSVSTLIVTVRLDAVGMEVGEVAGDATGGRGFGTEGVGGLLPFARYRFHWAIIRRRCWVVNWDKQLSSL